jgi:NADH:ubiquinone oxidoreductase subunit C
MCDQDPCPQTAPVDEVFVVLPAARLHQAVAVLIDRFDVYHLSTITAQDIDGEIELLYHFWHSGGLTLRTSVPRGDAHIASLTDLIPGAAFYEREVSEMLHVTFDGHPDPRPLLLPDDWNGEAPLRSEFSPTVPQKE